MVINRYAGSKPMNKRVVESLETEEVEEVMDEHKYTVSSIVSDLIQKEWEAVDVINGYMIVAQEVNNEGINNILDLMLSDHYTHIGQLEGLLQNEVPQVEEIDNAKEEILDDAEEPVEVETSEEEEVVFPEDDIPAEVVDTIDFSKKEEE